MARKDPETVKVFADPSVLREAVGQPGQKGLTPDAMQLILVAEARDHGYVDVVAGPVVGQARGALFFGAALDQVGTGIVQGHGVHRPDADTLRRLDTPRFAKLRGIFEPGVEEERALSAAFDLLCAEEAGCEALLSCDEAFRARARETDIEHVPVVGPDELLEAVGNRIGRWATLKFLFRGRRRIRDARAQARKGSIEARGH